MRQKRRINFFCELGVPVVYFAIIWYAFPKSQKERTYDKRQTKSQLPQQNGEAVRPGARQHAQKGRLLLVGESAMTSDQKKVFDAVKANPGAQTADVARLSGIMSSDSMGGSQNWEAHYILEDLEGRGVLKSTKDGPARSSPRRWYVAAE